MWQFAPHALHGLHLSVPVRPGLQYILPATWEGARQRDLPLERLTQWLSAAPAELAGLAACKGALAPGMDADIVVCGLESLNLRKP